MTTAHEVIEILSDSDAAPATGIRGQHSHKNDQSSKAPTVALTPPSKKRVRALTPPTARHPRLGTLVLTSDEDIDVDGLQQELQVHKQV